MEGKQQIDVDIRLWSDGDLPLLERLLGDPVMTAHLGGPEKPEKLRERHAKYCQCDPDNDAQFAIVAGPGRIPAGWVGYWEREWEGAQVFETGWLVLPEFQGKGVATMAAGLMVRWARAHGNRQFMHAYPSVDNGPSNTICRKLGFTLRGEVSFDYPKGSFMRTNDWCLDLSDSGNET